MGQSLAIPRVISNDWKRLDLIVNKIKMRLGRDSSPTFTGITISGLTASTLVGADADKALESVTIGTGLDYTRPTLSLSHLGLEALTDPGADRIFFWDDNTTAAGWLAAGNSIAITTTTIDTIQDIRTSASPTFAGLHINSAEVTSTTLLTLESDISNNNEYNEILFKIAGGQNYGAIRSCVGVTAGDSYMSFFTTTDSGTLVRQVTIQHNGKVGFGTYNPETLLTMVSAAPYLTLYNVTEEDTDGGGESRIIGKREDGDGAGTAAGQIEISHDGSGVNDQLGKYVVSVNTGAGLVQALEIGSDLLATFAGAVNITTIAAEGSDVDKFLVDSSGVVKYRTGTQVLSDIGGQASGNYITALTGEVTASGPGSVAATIAANAVTYAKIQNVSATDKVLGRATAGAGVVEEIACTAAGRAILAGADAAAQKTTLSLNLVENTALSTWAGTTNITTLGTIATVGAITCQSTAAFEGASVTVGKASTTTGTLILHDSGSANTITLTVPDSLAASLSFTLPPTDGANTNVLQTDGNGVLTWVAAGGGGASTWIALTDTDPANYTGQAGSAVVVNAGEDGLEFGAAPGGAFTSQCRVYKSSAQALPWNSTATITLDTEEYDNNAEFADNKFTVKVTGYYHITAHVVLDSLGAGKYLTLTIRKNIGATAVAAQIFQCGAAISAYCHISTDVYLEADEYIYLTGYHTHGSDRNIRAGTDATYMSVHRFV